MFIGKYYHTIEANGRISLPKNFRAQSESWVVTRGLDGGLFLYKAQDFQKELKKLGSRTFTKKKNRDFIRLLSNDAKEVTPDNNGRVQLPEYLIEFANLDKAAVVIGSFEKIEIWDRDSYHKYIDSIESNAEAIAEEIENDENN